MKRALILETKVVEVALSDFPVASEMFWTDCPDECVPGWEYDSGTGTVSAPTVPPETTNEKYIKYKTFADERLFDEAFNRSYNSSIEMVSYINSANATYKADATTYSGWRDSVKAYVDPVYQDILNQTGAEPTFDDFKTNFPPYPA